MALQRLVYVSTAAGPFSDSDLDALLIQAKSSNAKMRVTGLLVFNGLNFMQAIEGEATEIAQLFQRISRDSRHSGVIKISQIEISERAFAKWSMVIVRVPADADSLQQHLGAEIPNDITDAFAALARLGF